MQTATLNEVTNYEMARNPLLAIQQAAYNGQPEHMKRWVGGYQYYFQSLPVLFPEDPLFEVKTKFSIDVLNELGKTVAGATWLPKQHPNSFSRSIIGIEEPTYGLKGGAEVIIAHWGKGFTSPIHGHIAGLHYENVLSGEILANSYRQVDPTSKTVRLVKTELVKPGPFVTKFEEVDQSTHFVRSLMIHNFTALEDTHSLHFLPEHSLDGMGNGFDAEYFEDVHPLVPADLTPITAQQGLHLPIGTVLLVRSSNVPYFGDHFIIITGSPVMKEHGLRPQDIAIQAPHVSKLLDIYSYPAAHVHQMDEFPLDWSSIATPGLAPRDLVLLRLSDRMERAFLQFHGYSLEGNTVNFAL